MIRNNRITAAVIGGTCLLTLLCTAVPPKVLIGNMGTEERAVSMRGGAASLTNSSGREHGNHTVVFTKINHHENRAALSAVLAVDRESSPEVDVKTTHDNCSASGRFPNEQTLELAQCLNLQGVAALKAGQFVRAQTALERALNIRKQMLGARHPEVAVSLNNLAELYRTQGRVNDAQPLFEHALAIREETLGKDHPDVAQSLNNLALIYEQLRQYKLAETLYTRARAMVETGLGHEHPDLANILNNLAGLYYTQERYTEAEPLFKRAQAIWESHQDLSRLATSVHNLAQLYRATGRHKQAESLCQTALSILNQALGPNHPNVATAMETYAELLEDMKQHDKARRLKTRARAIRERSPMGFVD